MCVRSVFECTSGDDWGERGWISNQGLIIRPYGCIQEVQRGAIRCKIANGGGVRAGDKRSRPVFRSGDDRRPVVQGVIGGELE